jgi:hypothetical protein
VSSVPHLIPTARVRHAPTAHQRAQHPHSVEPGRFLEADELRFDDSNAFDLLYLLNEDLFQGGLTDAPFRSDRKSPR